MNANFAYRTLNHRGFTKNNIYYLTSDITLDLDNNGKPDDVDGDATNKNLQNAITTWAKDADNLIVYLVDHGGKEKFRMSETETLSATDLNSWLDQIQETIQGKVIVIYDACMSGSFLDILTFAADKDRIVITSTSSDENAYFISQGSLSFSNFFWTNIFNGDNIGKAFNLAEQAISNVADFQQPHMIGNPDTIIGNGTANNWDSPEISIETPVNGTIYANVTDKDGIARVWAVIIPPDYNQQSSKNPVLELPSFELKPVQGEDNRYVGTYNKDFNIHIQDTANIAIYAKDRIGNTSVVSGPFKPVENRLLQKKAIIVAGGSQSDETWPAIRRNANFAYNALKFQGYTDDHIFFTGPAPDQEGWDRSATLGSLRDAIERWASENTHDLVIYLVGNNNKDGRTFRISNTETLSIDGPDGLDNWLDTLQNKIKGKLTLICDTDYSGSFLHLLKPPQGKERIIISGTSNDHKALFLSQGTISFSSFFWKSVLNGMTVWDAFLKARNSIGLSKTPSYNKPQMDDNGNGIGNERSDGHLAMSHTIGMGIRFAENDPFVRSVSSPDHRLTGGDTSAEIQADVTSTYGEIAKVWAVITPPDCSPNHPNRPNLSLREIELSDAGDGRYKGTYDDFSCFGTYQADLYAMDKDDNISFLKNISIFQPAFPDSYEEDDTPDQAKVIIINDETPQHHNLYDAGDEDWIKFYGLSEKTYDIITENMGTNFKANIEIYDRDIKLKESGYTPHYSWECKQEGTYYVKISHAGVYGEDTEYDIKINQSTAPLSGWIRGKITEAHSEKPIQGDFLIKVEKNHYYTRLEEGNYYLNHGPGTYTVQICGHEFENVIISEGGTTTIRDLEFTENETEKCLTENSDPSVPDCLPALHTDDVKSAECFIGAVADLHSFADDLAPVLILLLSEFMQLFSAIQK